MPPWPLLGYGVLLAVDLKTMEMRVLSSEHYGRPFYLTLHMFVADMRRMFGNARTYNAPDTIYFKAANRWG